VTRSQQLGLVIVVALFAVYALVRTTVFR